MKNALDTILEKATCPDIKILYTLWLGSLTIEAMDTRTGKTFTRVFPGATSAVAQWLESLQG